MTDESGHEGSGAGATDPAGAPSPTEQQAILQQEQQLWQADPQLAAEIQQQYVAAEQAIALDPQHTQQIQVALERTVVQEIAPVDPQLAQELAAEIPTTATPQPSQFPSQPGSPVPSPQILDQQIQQFEMRYPQLAAEIQAQMQQANEQALAHPTETAAIFERAAQQRIQEIARVDPKLAQELSAQLHGQDLMFNAQGEVEQGPTPSNQTIGDPNQDGSLWTFQGANGYCGPNSISMMLEAAAGLHISEQQIVDWAMAHGEMSRFPAGGDPATIPSIHYGMTPEQAAQAINQLGAAQGVSAQVQYGNMSELESCLRQGREVMIAVDALKIWHEPGTADPGQPDHFVVVTGFDPATNTVYINDPGVMYGKAEAVPLSEFEAAWATSKDVMIVTETRGAAGDAEATPGPVLLPVTLDASLVRAV